MPKLLIRSLAKFSARGGQPHYLNAGEKALFARLPVGLQPEDYQLAQKVYAGILSAQEPDFVPKYLAGEEA
jgi:hypothetical protein